MKAADMKSVQDICTLLPIEGLIASLSKSVNDTHQSFGFSLQERLEMTAKLSSAEHGNGLMGSPAAPSLISAEEVERKRISRELHDGLGQLLTSMNLKIQECLSVTTDSSRTEQPIPKEVADALESVSFMVKQAMGEVRSICGALRPSLLDDLGVLAAISWQCRQITKDSTGSRVNVSTDFRVHEGMIPEEYKTAVYRITQEALNNALKHSRAKYLTVSIQHEGDRIRLAIQDDGIGFDAENLRSLKSVGMGLGSMRERVESLGGDFHLISSAGRGVRVEASFRLEKVALSG